MIKINLPIIVFIFVMLSQNVSAAIPIAPTNLTATAVSLNQINLVWHDNATDETSYEVEYLSGQNWISLGSVPASTTVYDNTFYHTGITPGTTFKYRVSAKNANGNSVYSNEVQASTPLSKGSGARYETKIFTSLLTTNIQYGTAATSILDIFEPSGDTSTSRPLVIFIHGGGFSSGDKAGSSTNWNGILCENLAKRGYVVASINYRLTYTQTSLAQRYQAMVRAVQDAKAAIRFFRKNATTYRIDPDQIFATGSSAGSITALHLAYLEQSEVPTAYISDWSLFDGSLEGNSGNPGYSSSIQGVISNWGALGELDYMKSGDAPVFSVHGTNDVTISYDKSPAYNAMNYGSKPITENALDKGIRAGLLLFSGAGHTLSSSVTYFNQAADAIGGWLCTVLKIYTESPSAINELQVTEGEQIVNVYPNPLKQDKLTLRIEENGVWNNGKVQISDLQGKIVYQTSFGNNKSLEINRSELPKSSIYFISVKYGQSIVAKKLIVQ